MPGLRGESAATKRERERGLGGDGAARRRAAADRCDERGSDGGRGTGQRPTVTLRQAGRRAALPAPSSPCGPQGDGELTSVHRHAVLRIVTDTDVRLWRRVHMDLVRYAGCVCRPSC
ncbi:putative leader peptide [Streptomyces sp. ID05-04B]|uniref:putative leader peptide n=1 Tax=unclassified Streptomyces TaxID=2593676 RepID=UPI0029C9C8C1|nr:putative leader peptide [Streptomyces sp. ID05-04B]